MSTDSVTVKTRIDVDVETAFDVFTSEIDTWWRRGPRFRPGRERLGAMVFEPRVGGRLVEAFDDGDTIELGRISVWDPPAHLVFDIGGRDFGPDDPRSLVDVRFETDGAATLVTLRNSGYDAMAPDHPVRHGLQGTALTQLMGVWWGDLLTALRAHASER